jgi:hypothetical protein
MKMKTVGTVKIALASGPAEVPAIRIGKFWAAHSPGGGLKLYNVSHIGTGAALVRHLKLGHAYRLVGVLDVLMPVDDYESCHKVWNQFPAKLREAFVDMAYTA